MIEPGSTIQVRDRTGATLSYVVQGQRGAGGQGTIYALATKDGPPAVLKFPNAKGIVGAEIERRILGKIDPHRNVVRLLGTASVQGVECAVLAYAHKNPFTRLAEAPIAELTKPFRSVDSPRVPLPATTAVEIIHELLAALEHLHANGYTHGDVKSPNVMVELASSSIKLTNREYFSAIQSRAYRTVLIDFGTARSTSYLVRSAQPGDEAVVPFECTPLYAPPEVIKGIGDSRGGPFADVYAAGVFFYELLTGHYPYDHVIPDVHKHGLTAELADVKRSERQGVRRPFDPQRIMDARQHDVVFAEAFAAQRLRDRFYENARRVIDAATSPDPARRPTAGALRHEVIRAFELEPPASPPPDGRPFVSMTNPRWHLVRTNRLSEAARVPDPQPGTGAIRAPAPAAPTSSQEIVASDVPRPDPSGYRVALIDDDKVTLTILAGTLRRRGFRVRTFQDPEQALDVLSRDHPDVAVCDMNMPGMTGLALIKKLQQRLQANAFPIMILSSEGQERTLAEAYHLGVTDYLVKPVSEAELVVKIEAALDRKRERPPEAVPRELAGFELGEEVRRGEAAVLFRATRPDELDLVRAAKVLRPDLAGEPEPLLRLRREIDVAARSDHPAIPHVLATGLVGRLLFWIGDEVPAQTLGERVRERGRLDPAEAVHLLREVGGALRHLHGRQLLLGDLTPETIAWKETGQLLLADLGAARWIDAAPRWDEAPLRMSRYVAPELLDEGARPDPRQDLYALGVCALEAVLGRPAAPGERGVDPRQVASVPGGLAPIIARLVAPFPDDRYASAQALLAGL